MIPALQVHDLCQKYRDIPVLRGLSWSLEAGQTGVVLGRSGCGKTSLLLAIAGLVPLIRGRIEIRGHDVTQAPAHQRDVAMGFQHDGLYPHQTIGQTLTLAAKRGGHRNPVDAATTLAAEIGIRACLESRPESVSGGQRQRAAMVKMILRNAPICLLDEPLASVDSISREEQLDMLWRLKHHHGDDRVFVHVTHDGDEAMRLADRLAVLHGGVMVQSGTPQELFDAPETLSVARSLGRPPINWIPKALLTDAQRSVADAIATRSGRGHWDGVAVRPDACRVDGTANVDAEIEDDGGWVFAIEVQAAVLVGRDRLLVVVAINQPSVTWRVVVDRDVLIPTIGGRAAMRIQANSLMPLRDDSLD